MKRQVSGGVSWPARIALGVLVFVGIEVTCRILDTTVDHLRLALVVALLVAACSVLIDAAPVEASPWPHHPDRRGAAAGQDPRTASYLRILESHRTARETDGALRDRLGTLADQVLSVRYDLTRTDHEAQDLLGAGLARVLTEAPRRLSVAEIDQHVRRIEAM